MSGRPYARNLRAPFVGATDLDAVLPHSFRIKAPLPTSSAKQRAIHSAIRRRCMEKNWKKMFSLRHKRLSREEEEGEAQQEPASDANTTATAEEATTEATAESEAPKPEEKPRAEEDAENQKQKEKEEQLAAAKLQLEALKKKLTELTDQKHDKFLLLKQILVQEARSKTSAPAASGAANPAKKRRLDDAGGFSPLSASSQPAGTLNSSAPGMLDGSTPGSAATSASN